MDPFQPVGNVAEVGLASTCQYGDLDCTIDPMEPDVLRFTITAHVEPFMAAAATFQLLTGVAEDFRRATHAITATILDECPAEPWKPVRLPRWTARQYRAARRAYRRQCKAWAKAGRTSTVERRLYIPRATIDYAEWQRADLT